MCESTCVLRNSWLMVVRVREVREVRCGEVRVFVRGERGVIPFDVFVLRLT
jgi:hypothetical protein